MDDHKQAPARMLAGALAHLAQHMESGCPRAAYLAAMLLEQIAADPDADTHLRQHALQLVDILERDPVHAPASDSAPLRHSAVSVHRPSIRKSVS